MSALNFVHLTLTWLSCLPLFAQTDQPTDKQQAPPRPPQIVATVGPYQITRQSVEALISRRVTGIFQSQAGTPETFQIARQQLIDQAIVLDYLESRPKAKPLDISVEIKKIEDELARSEQTLDQWLADTKRHRVDLEFKLRWRKRWGSYLERWLNDPAARKSAFERWHFQFDGSKVEVAQILLKRDSQRSRKTQTELKQLAQSIWTRLTNSTNDQSESPQTTVDAEIWKEEVLTHSDSPNRNAANTPGYVGWIEYQTPMPERFSIAAFDLSVDQVSKPIETGLGIHIIRLLKKQPGKRSQTECKTQLDRVMKREAFQNILRRHRKQVDVQTQNTAK